MGKAIRASAVVLLLACSAHAGEIQNGVTSTPPSPAPATQEEQAGGIIPNDAAGHIHNDATGGLTGTVLDLLAGALALV